MENQLRFSQWGEIPDYDMGEPFYKEGVKWTTRHNFELEKKHIDRAVLHDVTLRDGDQTPGSVFLEDERVRIADALAEMKMPRIEAGMPVVSKTVENAMRRMVARHYPHSRIYGFARAVKGDVDLCRDVGCQGIIIEYCVNPVIIKHAYRKTPGEVAANLIETIRHAKDIGFEDVAFMGWDWFRTPVEFTRPLIQEIYDNTPLDGLVIVDTYGSSTPDAVEEMFRRFKEWFPRLRLEFHGHTDNGCGSANCLAALWGGAEVLHTSLNGMGERCGNHPTEEVAVLLEVHKGIDTGLELSKIAPACSVVSTISKIPFAANKPVMGMRALQIESGVSLDIEYKMAHNKDYTVTNIYNTVSPGVVGRQEEVHPVLGKNSGKSSIRLILEQRGIPAADEEIHEVLERVKAEAYVTKSGVPVDMMLRFLESVRHEKEAASRQS